jgi:glycosyltransferase involved in cell wall biosynthesis
VWPAAEPTAARSEPGASQARRRLLLVTLHYPPESGAAALRALKFTRYLGEHGWEAHVLTRRVARPPLDEASLSEVPPDVFVERALRPDTKEVLSVAGRYPAWLAVPDRHVLGWPLGSYRGILAHLRRPIDLIFSSSPAPTAHLIGRTVQRRTGAPWIAEFRDPWGAGVRRGPFRRAFEERLERRIARDADGLVVTTPEIGDDLAGRHGDALRRKTHVVYNGYDESDFADLTPARPLAPFHVVHAGTLDWSYRSPLPFLHALRACLDRGRIPPETRVTFLGSGDAVTSPSLSASVSALRLAEVVRLVDPVPHRQALSEMLGASLLLLLQGGGDVASCIPSKAFEYLRSGRPVLAVTPRECATRRFVERFEACLVADEDRPVEIGDQLAESYRRLDAGRFHERPALARFERRVLTAELAGILDRSSSCATAGEGG